MSAARLWRMVDPGSETRGAHAFRWIHHGAVALGVLAVAAETQPDHGWEDAIDLAISACIAFFAAEFLLRLALAPQGPWARPRHPWLARLRWLATPAAIVDLVAALAVPLALTALKPGSAHLLGMLWTLKLARWSSGLGLLGRVLRNAGEPLVSVMLGFCAILLTAATAAYLIEGEAQPEAFGSIPRAMWWTVATLTTTGYGDAVPASLTGRLLGGLVMVCGIGVFGLWAGILASGFADELRRRHFLRNWDLVARTPFFRHVGADAIAEVARLLRRRQVAARHAVVRRGQAGDAMYFIVSGEVEVQLENGPVRLGEGAFFGEMALISGGPRTATVTARKPTVLLELDVADFRELAGRRPELLRAVHEAAALRARG